MELTTNAIEQAVERAGDEQRKRASEHHTRGRELAAQKTKLAQYVADWQTVLDRIRELDAAGPPLLARLDGLANQRDASFVAVVQARYTDEVAASLRAALSDTLASSRMFQSLVSQAAGRGVVPLGTFA